jgi:DNA-binding MarR family transcriptional regulator
MGRSESLLFLTDEQLRRGIEAMFFAYRGFTADPDRILQEYGYGRAHHRAIHFINRSPGTTVNNLLSILGVTKQSLNRVLRTLVEDGLVDSRVGTRDKRERHLPDRGGRRSGTATVRGAAHPHAHRLPQRRARGRGRASARCWNR